MTVDGSVTGAMMRSYNSMRRLEGFDALTLPAEHFVLMRAVMLLIGLLGQLRARGRWLDVAREWLFGDEPRSELGRAEAEFFSDRPYPTAAALSMTTAAAAPARPPRSAASGSRGRRSADGLATDGRLVRGLEGADIACFSFAGRRVFALGHPDYADHVLHGGVDRYHKSIEYELLRAVVGLSLFTDEDSSWRKHRMMLNPVLAKRHVDGLCELMIDPIEEFVARFDTGANRIEIDMTRAMTELTLDVVGSALFGRGMADLARRIGPAVTSALRAAERATRLIMLINPPWWLTRASANFIHHAPLLPPPLSRLQTIMRTVDEMMWNVIDDRRANPAGADDLLGLLLTVRDEHGQPLPAQRVRDEATTFMLAGHETTANALSWMWYLLALNPEARDRMLAEVDEVLGGRRPAAC